MEGTVDGGFTFLSHRQNKLQRGVEGKEGVESKEELAIIRQFTRYLFDEDVKLSAKEL
jgi:hypothetical protein